MNIKLKDLFSIMGDRADRIQDTSEEIGGYYIYKDGKQIEYFNVSLDNIAESDEEIPTDRTMLAKHGDKIVKRFWVHTYVDDYTYAVDISFEFDE